MKHWINTKWKKPDLKDHTYYMSPYLWKVYATSLQSCPALCNPMNCSPPGFSVHGIFQARILEWVTIPFSRRSPWLRDWTHVSCISYLGRRILYHCTTCIRNQTIQVILFGWGLVGKNNGYHVHLVVQRKVEFLQDAKRMPSVLTSFRLAYIPGNCLNFFVTSQA